jgi:hypothetical protein
MRFAVKDFFPTSRLKQERRKISTSELLIRRSNLLCFLNQAPRSSFKKQIVMSPTLLRGLHQMSMLKTVPEGLKPENASESNSASCCLFSMCQESKGFYTTSYVRGQRSRVLNQEFLYFGSQVAVFTSNPSCLKYWLLRFLFYKEAMCKGSTGNGLLYTAKAVP